MGWFQQVSDAVDQIRWTGISSIAEDDSSRIHNQGWCSGRREIPGILRERPVDLVLHAKYYQKTKGGEYGHRDQNDRLGKRTRSPGFHSLFLIQDPPGGCCKIVDHNICISGIEMPLSGDTSSGANKDGCATLCIATGQEIGLAIPNHI